MSYRDIASRFGLASAEAQALQWALHLERTINAAAVTGRTLRKVTMRGLVVRGLVKEILAVVVDGDGFALEPEREKIAYRLTEEGRKVAGKINTVETAAVFDVLVEKPSRKELRFAAGHAKDKRLAEIAIRNINKPEKR